MKRPKSIPKPAWDIMQFMRNGNNLCIPTKGKPYAEWQICHFAGVDFLLEKGYLALTNEYHWGKFYRMTDKAWAIAAGDK